MSFIEAPAASRTWRTAWAYDMSAIDTSLFRPHPLVAARAALAVSAHLVYEVSDRASDRVRIDDEFPLVALFSAHRADAAIPRVFPKETTEARKHLAHSWNSGKLRSLGAVLPHAAFVAIVPRHFPIHPATATLVDFATAGRALGDVRRFRASNDDFTLEFSFTHSSPYYSPHTNAKHLPICLKERSQVAKTC